MEGEKYDCVCVREQARGIWFNCHEQSIHLHY